MGTYLVTGATGRVGSVVARELLVRGETPRVIADALRGADGLFTLLPGYGGTDSANTLH